MISPAFSSSFKERLTVMGLRNKTAAMAVTGKQTNRIPFSSSCPLDSIASSIRQYMTFAVLLTGNPVNALGNGKMCIRDSSYPFVDLPSGDTLRCKLFPADKFHKIRYLFDRR